MIRFLELAKNVDVTLVMGVGGLGGMITFLELALQLVSSS